MERERFGKELISKLEENNYSVTFTGGFDETGSLTITNSNSPISPFFIFEQLYDMFKTDYNMNHIIKFICDSIIDN